MDAATRAFFAELNIWNSNIGLLGPWIRRVPPSKLSSGGFAEVRRCHLRGGVWCKWRDRSGGNSERLSLFFASNFREKSSLSFMRSADCDLHHDRACAGPNLRGEKSWAPGLSTKAWEKEPGVARARACARAPKRTCPQIKNDGRSSWFERVLIHVS